MGTAVQNHGTRPDISTRLARQRAAQNKVRARRSSSDPICLEPAIAAAAARHQAAEMKTIINITWCGGSHRCGVNKNHVSGRNPADQRYSIEIVFSKATAGTR